MLKLVKTNVSQFKFFRCTRILFEKYREKKLFQLLLSFLMDKVSKVIFKIYVDHFLMKILFLCTIFPFYLSFFWNKLHNYQQDVNTQCLIIKRHKSWLLNLVNGCFFCESRLTSLCLQTYHHKHQQYK